MTQKLRQLIDSTIKEIEEEIECYDKTLNHPDEINGAVCGCREELCIRRRIMRGHLNSFTLIRKELDDAVKKIQEHTNMAKNENINCYGYEQGMFALKSLGYGDEDKEE